MLPEVKLRDVSRDDVDRIAWWLQDQELSSRWFGHYACGDPVHRGYDPERMLEASEWEWRQVFGDSRRLIFSIYSDLDAHIGECQMVLDGEGGSELALLIGRKDQWHRGYGTSAVMQLLDKAFGDLGLDRAWVNVPEDNPPATGLFEKLGFRLEETRELCKRPDGSPLNASILVADARSYRASRPDADSNAGRVATISGLSGSGSEAIGAEVARMVGSRFVESEISDLLCQRLRCTLGELEALQASYRSFWSRLLNSVAVPMEWSAGYDAGYHVFWPESNRDHHMVEHHVTKKQYLDALAGVVRMLSAEGNVVLHGHGSHLFVPSSVHSINVFVTASPAFRQQRAAVDKALGSKEGQEWLERTDRDVLSVFNNLLDTDLLDMGRYDLTVNADRVSFETAAQIIVGAMGSATPSVKTRAAGPRGIPTA